MYAMTTGILEWGWKGTETAAGEGCRFPWRPADVVGASAAALGQTSPQPGLYHFTHSYCPLNQGTFGTLPAQTCRTPHMT